MLFRSGGNSIKREPHFGFSYCRRFGWFSCGGGSFLLIFLKEPHSPLILKFLTSFFHINFYSLIQFEHVADIIPDRQQEIQLKLRKSLYFIWFKIIIGICFLGLNNVQIQSNSVNVLSG
jgi:hypothetical protein